jgi:hypothetical protein
MGLPLPLFTDNPRSLIPGNPGVLFGRASTEEQLVRLEHALKPGSLATLAARKRDRIMYAQNVVGGTPAPLDRRTTHRRPHLRVASFD